MDHLESLLPGLRGSGCVVTSPEDIRCDGLAWAAEDEEHWWWPNEDSHWPEEAAREETIAAVVAAYGVLGFVSGEGLLVEQEYEDMVIYTSRDGTPTHVARQLQFGLWSSKRGLLQDVEHRTVAFSLSRIAGHRHDRMGRL
jgi:hypothetical protein